jgi:hypothetical protein
VTTERPRAARPARARTKDRTTGRKARRAAKQQERAARPPIADRFVLLRWWPRRPLSVVYDVNGPKVRLGVLWFLANAVALTIGLELITPLWAATAAVAALQMSRAWRKEGQRAHRAVAGIGAALLPIAAAISVGFVGVVVLLVVAISYYLALIDLEGGHPVDQAGYTLQCALFPGLAAAGVVTTLRFDVIAAIGLLLLVSAYEAGDFLIGSGARWKWEGPVMGMVAVGVMAFALSTPRLPPFVLPDALWLGAMVAVLCPVGQLLASALLPSNATRAPALRRIDSMLLLAPAWAYVVGVMTQT